jgi:dTDP-6-deoxy-L-talose 4-dehydrogenase (NAD+)
MTIALTGATGFVGRHVLRALIEADYSVRVIVRDPSRLQPESNNKRVEIIQIDDLFSIPQERLRNLLYGTKNLIHAAWYVEPEKYLTSTLNIECLKGTLALGQAFAEAGGERFIGIGTCFEYEISAEPISIEGRLVPATLYSACKVAAFHTLQRFFADRKIAFAWCRLFYLYGEGEDERRLVPYVRQRLAAGQEVLLTHGNQIRDFLEVKEAARIIARIALGGGQGAFNVCSGRGVTVKKLVESIADEYGRRDLLKFGARQEKEVSQSAIVGIPNSF